MNSYITHLECARCGTRYSSDQIQNLCSCGSPLFARYDLGGVSSVISPDDFGFRVHSLWRFKEFLPVKQPENMISLYEGFTPLIRSQRIGQDIGLDSLHFKDESNNPTGSFKARGLCVAVSKARELGVKEICLPTAGNAGGAAAAYAARAGMKCHVFMPSDTPAVFSEECRALGADVRMVEGLITDAGRQMQAPMREHGWFDVSTLKEPYRVEGKKTILLEIAQQMNWHLPDVILFPTGGGTGIVGAWKACQELRQTGWIKRFKMPRLIAVQAAGCAPIVRAYEQGMDTAAEWENPQTASWGLRVPKAIADFLILRAIRESDGSAVAVDEESIAQARSEAARKEGMWIAPEAAAAIAGLRDLVSRGIVKQRESVVLLVTGSGLKYV